MSSTVSRRTPASSRLSSSWGMLVGRAYLTLIRLPLASSRRREHNNTFSNQMRTVISDLLKADLGLRLEGGRLVRRGAVGFRGSRRVWRLRNDRAPRSGCWRCRCLHSLELPGRPLSPQCLSARAARCPDDNIDAGLALVRVGHPVRLSEANNLIAGGASTRTHTHTHTPSLPYASPAPLQSASAQTTTSSTQ